MAPATGPPKYKYEQKRKKQLDANQQAVKCMLQEISYICIGKGIRKCCSIDSLSDTQCLNTEQFYHSQMLEDENDLIDNDQQVFQGKNAYFPENVVPPANPEEPEEDPDEDFDQDTIYKNQKIHDVSFEKS